MEGGASRGEPLDLRDEALDVVLRAEAGVATGGNGLGQVGQAERKFEDAGIRPRASEEPGEPGPGAGPNPLPWPAY